MQELTIVAKRQKPEVENPEGGLIAERGPLGDASTGTEPLQHRTIKSIPGRPQSTNTPLRLKPGLQVGNRPTTSPPARQHANTSDVSTTRQYVSTTTHQHVRRQHTNTTARQHVNTSAHQHDSTTTHQHTNTPQTLTSRQQHKLYPQIFQVYSISITNTYYTEGMLSQTR